MKILKRVTAIALTSTFLISSTIKPARPNPAIIAPVALCAGTAGLGCVLIGVVAIAGITYYVWEYGGGKRVVVDAKGTIFQSADYLEDPEAVNNPEQHETSGVRDPKYAEKKCKAEASGRKYIAKYRDQSGYWICIYR